MRDAGAPLPYWRLSGFYFFYFASLGALLPYWSLYLKSLGFGPVSIGELMAVLMGTKIVAPNVWGWIADRRGKRLGIVRWASLLGALAFIGVYFNTTFWWFALVMAVFSFFWNASLPQFEAITLNHLGTQAHRYTQIRLWGSVGFILAVVVLGRLLESLPMDWIPHTVMVLMVGIWVSSLLVPERAERLFASNDQPLGHVLRRPQVLALLAVCFLMQASHGPYFTFFSIYLEGYGYAPGVIGELWALGVIAEVGLFLVMHRLLERFSLRTLFLACFALTSLRWTMIASFPENLTMLLIAQLLHAASFGVYHAVAIQLIHRFFVGRHQGRGQALYSSMSFGAGGAAGSLASGYAWEGIGPPFTYLASAVVSAIALLIAWRWIEGVESEGVTT